MTLATRDTFLKPVELKTKTIETETFGSVRIRQLAHSELTEFQSWLRPGGKLDTERYDDRDLKLMTLSVVDENGKTILSEADIQELKKQPGSEVDEVTYEVLLINGYLKPIVPEQLLGKSES